MGVSMEPRPETSWQGHELACEALHRAAGIVALAGHVAVHEVDTEGIFENILSALGDAMATAHELIGEALLLFTDDLPDEPEEGQP